MEFAAFASRASVIEAESADETVCNRVTDLLAATGEDLEIVARYVQGRVFPAHASTKLDVGPSLCYEAIAKAAGHNVTSDDVESRLAEMGEIGAVAASYEFGAQQGLGAFGGGSSQSESLDVSDVDDRLRELADAAGSGSQDTKRDILFDLFNRSSGEEARYLARLVLSEMRIGVGEGTVRDAIAAAFDVPVDEVERALQVTNDYGQVASVARDSGGAGLEELGLVVGRPVQAMLAQAGTVTDAIEAWDETGVEWKFDGARVQVHYDGSAVRLFSRNMEEVTDPLPDVVERVESTVDGPAILDGEVIAVDEAGDPLPFQEVLRRFRRKHDVARAREDVAVELRVFDCLHADGMDLLDEPLTVRRNHLDAVVSDSNVVSRLWLTSDPDQIEAVEAAALEAGHEGILLKNPQSTYSPGRRGKEWLKRKPDVETLDLVVTGAEWGEGRRANLLGTFELSARTEDDGFVTVGNVATGISDEQLESLTDRLKSHVRTERGTAVDLDPAVVFEVGYEEIQDSTTYDSGYALRFPRFLSVREDKNPDDAESVERIERLAARQ